MRLPLVLTLLALFSGCDSAAAGLAYTGTLAVGLADLQSNTDPTARPQPTLALATDEIFGCANYRLNVAVRRSGRTLDLTVRDVELLGEVCLTALGPATFQTPLDVPAGTYRLRIRTGGAVDEYDLRVEADRLVLDSVRAERTRVPEPLVWRYPERSFVYTCGTFTGDEALCGQFQARLEAAVALSEVAVPSEGVWPYPREPAGYYHNAPSRVYRYASETDFETAKDLLHVFTAEALVGRMGVGLAVANWRGDAGLSWVYENEMQDPP